MRIAVVGCGTAGPASAIFLTRAGHDVVVFERAPVIAPIGAGMLLQPTGIAVLAQLGLLDRIRECSAEIRHIRGRTQHGRMVMDFHYGQLHEDLYALGIHRGTLSDALKAGMAAEGIEVHVSVTITGRRGGILLGAEEFGEFDLIVAADGSHSVLRRELGGSLHEYNWGALWAIIDDEGDQYAGTLEQTFRTTHQLLGLLPIGAGRLSLFWSIRADQIDTVRTRGLDAFKNQVHGLHPGLGHLLDQITDMDQLLVARYLDVKLRQWHADRMVVLGDAGHAMSPQLGQGVNLALVDALILAQTIAAGQDLAAYSRARRKHLRYYRLMSRLLNGFYQHVWSVMALPRDLLIPLGFRNTWSRKVMLETMTGQRTGIFRQTPLDLRQP